MFITKHQERKARETRKNERVRLLLEIDELDNKRCEKCEGIAARIKGIKGIMCDCYAAVRIREIGEEFASINTTRSSTPALLKKMTAQEYKKYKKQGLRDSEIAAIYNVTRSGVWRWKRRRGLLDVK